MHSSKLSRAAIDVLSDIPLLCEGVTGIGIFMVLFFVKKVCRMSIFLHSSSFLSFAAATLNLGRVVMDSGKDARAFIITREVLLVLTHPLLYLYLWELVAECPRSEANSLISTKKQKWHSASWNRWGVPGHVLKWMSLATLLSVPALQLVWRLVPAERRHSAIYVADSILQTTLSFFFILKFVFNAYGPLSRPFWLSFLPNVAPILTLSINVCLSVGNLPIFAFADSPLGLFLHAIGIYILLLYNLYSAFQDFIDSTLIYNKRRDQPIVSISQFHGKGNPRTPVLDERSRRSPLKSPPLLSSLAIPQQDILRAKPVGLPSDEVDSIPRKRQDGFSSSIRLSTLSVPSPSSPTSDFSMTQESSPVIRPDSQILTALIRAQDLEHMATPALEVQFDGLEATALDLDPRDSEGSEEPRSLSSLDHIFRHRDELDKNIAALRELSRPSSVLYDRFSALDFPQTGIPVSTTPSDNSLLSLSIFPHPPSNLMARDSMGDIFSFRPSDPSFGVRNRRLNLQPFSTSSILSPGMFQSWSSRGRESMGRQWDVTSFIRNPANRRARVASMYAESGVGAGFPRTYSELINSPILEVEGEVSVREPIE